MLKAFFGDIEIKTKVIISPILYPKVIGEKGQRTPLNYTIGNVNDLTFIKCGVGPSHIGDLTLMLGKTVCKTAYLVGTVGAISEKLNIGDTFIADSATDGEGFSGWLKGKNINQTYEPSETLSDEARSIFPNSKNGRILTMGTLLAQNKENAKGFDALDMECSAFFAAAKKSQIDAAGIFIVSDLPLKHPFYQNTHDEHEIVKQKLDGILQIIINL